MAEKRDPILLATTIIAVAFGVMILISASLGLFEKGGAPSKLIFRQLAFGLGAGIPLFYICDKIHYNFWRKTSFLIFLAALLLTVLVFIPGIGFKSGGAARWVSFGGIFFQPSEFLKLGFIIYLSSWLSSRLKYVSSFKFAALPLFFMILVLAVIFIKQPDLGTMLVLIITSFFLFFIAGGRLKHLGLIGLIFVAILALVIYSKPYSFERIQVFFNSDYDPQGSGYQIRQASIALGSGGIFGKGFGKGVQKYNYLPESASDAVFAMIGEEFGFAGNSFLVLLFLLFMWRAFIVLKRNQDIFAGLLGSGIVILIIVQAFINMYAITGLMPLTGLTLPFISQGGSSLAVTLAAAGILSNISKKRR